MNMNILKLFIVLLVLSNAYTTNAGCTDSKTTLTRKDGRVIQWNNCFEEGNNYCTQTATGNICLQKKQFVSVETSNGISSRPDAVIVDNEDKFKDYNKKLELEEQERLSKKEEDRINLMHCLNNADELFIDDWNRTCQSENLGYHCNLPFDKSESLDAVRKHRKEYCNKRYDK